MFNVWFGTSSIAIMFSTYILIVFFLLLLLLLLLLLQTLLVQTLCTAIPFCANNFYKYSHGLVQTLLLKHTGEWASLGLLISSLV
jgi:hypothetical protein